MSSADFISDSAPLSDYSYLDMCRLVESLEEWSRELGGRRKLRSELAMKGGGIDELASFVSELSLIVDKVSQVNREREYLRMSLKNIEFQINNVRDEVASGYGTGNIDAAASSKSDNSIARSMGKSEGNEKKHSNKSNSKNVTSVASDKSISSNNLDASTDRITDNNSSSASSSKLDSDSDIASLMLSNRDMRVQEMVERNLQDRLATENLLKELAETLVPELLSKSQSIHETVRAQNVQLDAINEAIDKTGDALTEQRAKMDKRTEEEASSVFSTVYVILSMMLTFVFTYVIIRLFPKPS